MSTLTELRLQARQRGIPGLWKMNKAQLRAALKRKTNPNLASGNKVRMYLREQHGMGTCADLVQFGMRAREQGKTWAEIKQQVDRSARLSKKNGLKVACLDGFSQRAHNKMKREMGPHMAPFRPSYTILQPQTISPVPRPIAVNTPSYTVLQPQTLSIPPPTPVPRPIAVNTPSHTVLQPQTIPPPAPVPRPIALNIPSHTVLQPQTIPPTQPRPRPRVQVRFAEQPSVRRFDRNEPVIPATDWNAFERLGVQRELVVADTWPEYKRYLQQAKNLGLTYQDTQYGRFWRIPNNLETGYLYRQDEEPLLTDVQDLISGKSKWAEEIIRHPDEHPPNQVHLREWASTKRSWVGKPASEIWEPVVQDMYEHYKGVYMRPLYIRRPKPTDSLETWCRWKWIMSAGFLVEGIHM
jgi:hypothetical protein